MCSIFSSIRPQDYTPQSRSVRLGGHATSIRLEAMFWTMLEEAAAVQGVPLGRFLSKLHDETMSLEEESHNFTSLLRCACLTYVAEVKSKAGGITRFQNEALTDFERSGVQGGGRVLLGVNHSKN